jgi:hypothetical protein
MRALNETSLDCGEDIMRLGVFGSRTLEDDRVKDILISTVEELKADMIVTGGETGGVCDVARKLCQERSIPLLLHFLNFRYMGGAYDHRSKKVLKDSDFVVFIHDGKSKGTANELKLTEKVGKPYKYYKLDVVEKEVDFVPGMQYFEKVGFGI